MIIRRFQLYIEILSNLSSDWNGGGGMSAAPIYLGLMAIVGAYLIKNSARYIFTSEDSNKTNIEGKENGW